MTRKCHTFIVFLCAVIDVKTTTSSIPTTTTTITTTTTTTAAATSTVITANINEEFEGDGTVRDNVKNGERCGEQFLLNHGDFRIVGGQQAKVGEIPWQVALKYLYNFICGGTLIASQWVLTAAHCFDHLMQWQLFYTVAMATTNSNASTGGEFSDVEVERIIKHPGYSEETYAHDLALLRLKKSASSSPLVEPACLPFKGQKFYGHTCMTSGWGYLRESSNETETYLRKVSVKVQPRSNCTKSIGSRYFKVYHLCAGWQVGQRDTCRGDSGGPLVCPTKDKGSHSQRKVWTLAGIVSSGVGCGRPGKYGLYMNAEYYTDWIRETLENNDDSILIGR